MEDRASSAKENSGMALSGMIIGVVGLICAFLPAWRGFAIIIGCVGFIVSAYSFFKSNKIGSKKIRSVVGMTCSVIAICAGVYFLYLGPGGPADSNQEENPVPPEFHDSAALETDHTNALEKLQGLTDSADASKPQ